MVERSGENIADIVSRKHCFPTEEFYTLTVNVQDDVKAEQPNFEANLIKLIAGASPFPQPGRPLRNVAARSLVLLYTKGDSKSLYDALQTFLKTAGDAKALDTDMAKMYENGTVHGLHSHSVSEDPAYTALASLCSIFLNRCVHPSIWILLAY